MLYSIPASDYLTGKKRNALSDIQDYFSGDGEITVLVLSCDSSSLGMYYTSCGSYDTASIGDHETIEHTQTRAKKYVTIDNIVTLKFGKVVYAANDIGIRESDKKRPIWVAK